MITVGCKAPEFTLSDKDNKEVSLADFIGKKVVLYFYPRITHRGAHGRRVLLQKRIRDLKKRTLRL